MFEFEIPFEIHMQFWSVTAERAARMRAGLPHDGLDTAAPSLYLRLR
jgi:hypothetical protein